jgi:hypothetical protein
VAFTFYARKHKNKTALLFPYANSNQTIIAIIVLVWMAINAVFFALEAPLFNDAADLNNSILLILWIASMASLLITRKTGYAISLLR